jgi:trehalose/maltose hydrolase-like predicted phosphorylase
MASTWLSIIKGFGGQRITDDQLSFSPSLPTQWNSLSFKIKFRKNLLEVKIEKDKTKIKNLSGPAMELLLKGSKINLPESNIALS